MHGGDVYTHEVNLDFSVNLNPLGMPEEVRKAIENGAASTGRYPDPSYRRLRQIVGMRYGVPSERVVCGNGASELISAICRAVLLKRDFERIQENPEHREKSIPRALILAPGFTGYRRAIASLHADIITVDLSGENDWVPDDTLEEWILNEVPDLVILSNPSNPTGVLLERDRLIGLADICEDAGAFLCVDECFMELTGHYQDCSMTVCCSGPKVPCGNLIVLNAITKTYAVPGIRLGYAFCASETMADELSRQLPEWNVSTIAEEAAYGAFRTKPDYLLRAQEIIHREREYLSKELSACGCTVYPSEANYLLFHAPTDLYRPLLHNKMLIRDCHDYDGLGTGWYRIGVKQHGDNIQLIRAIQAAL